MDVCKEKLLATFPHIRTTHFYEVSANAFACSRISFIAFSVIYRCTSQ
jgi:hypothetical protein